MDLVDKVNDNSDEVIDMLVAEIISKPVVELHFEYAGEDQWAVVNTFREDDDTEISLRMHSGARYFLYLGYYDDKDEFLELVKPLTEEQVTRLPASLHKLLAKVLDDEQGMRVPGSLLLR